MAVCKINFTSLDNMPFGTWCEWATSGLNSLEFFAGITEENIDNFNLYDLQTVFYWLECLKDAEVIEAQAIPITSKSYAQKIDAVEVCQKLHNGLPNALPYIGAIFSQDWRTYNRALVQEKAKDWRARPYPEAYKESLGYLLGLQAYEEDMANSLKEIPYTQDQIDAGVKEFEKFGEFNTVHALAGKNILNREAVLSMKLAIVSQAIRYANLEAWVAKNMSDNQIAKMKAKQPL